MANPSRAKPESILCLRERNFGAKLWTHAIIRGDSGLSYCFCLFYMAILRLGGCRPRSTANATMRAVCILVHDEWINLFPLVVCVRFDLGLAWNAFAVEAFCVLESGRERKEKYRRGGNGVVFRGRVQHLRGVFPGGESALRWFWIPEWAAIRRNGPLMSPTGIKRK